MSIRRLENKVIEHLQRGLMVLEFANPVKVSIGQFAGIEINDFAVTVARTALWIAESQMIKETEAIVNQTIEFFPLKTDAKIVEGNALRMDWNDVISKYACSYIMGNPPFVANTGRTSSENTHTIGVLTDAQKEERKQLFGKSAGLLDYVSCWHKKAADYMKGTNISTAFVSTDSIFQGQQVAPLWKPLFQEGININYAYNSFKWNSDASNSATVYVVIAGFSYQSKFNKKIYDGESVKNVSHINAYLTDGTDVFVENRSKPICDVPIMTTGNRPADGGNLIIEKEDYPQFIKNEPNAIKFIKKFCGSEEFINKKERYCLWLVNATPKEIQSMPLVMKRVIACKEARLNGAPDRKKLADRPTLFRETKNPKQYIIVPKVSSINRKYIPIGFENEDTIASDLLFIIPDASLFHFGILTSNVHMAWVKMVCGYFGPSYRYSNKLAYNNFPWCNPSEAQMKKIELAAQTILDVRNKYENVSLANMYDNGMLLYPDLKKAHQANDRAVMEAYGMWGKVNSESECVAWLFRMYEELTKS